ncbi:zinc-binding dehydrogenase [Microlunatus soli]|uniref:NADPH:quinone reductase n=1 Tax=Microlunatus soli TaxID=630515 RepID=A0A1H1YX50_9ACTN|nr:zinc-binding dehydrogenase [Microlunatus soli]SDT25917.1 NADPH:quinone reductase [Microlunatus soli]
MRAAYLDPTTRGWTVCSVDPPEPAPDDVLIRTVSIGLNHADLLMRDGRYSPTDASWRVSTQRVGFELAGVVDAVGDRVSGVGVGDRVMAQVGGAAAELVAVPAALLLPLRGVDTRAAGGLPSGLLTEYDAFGQAGNVAGADVLITGGSSAVGRIGIQLARILGAASVSTTTRSAAKVAELRRLGADTVIIGDRLPTAAQDGSYDVVLDHVGGQILGSSVAQCRRGARIVQIGRLGGDRASIDLELLAARRLSIIGTTFRDRPLDELAALVDAVTADPSLVEAWGGIEVPIDSFHDLERIERAATALQHPGLAGKVIVTADAHSPSR